MPARLGLHVPIAGLERQEVISGIAELGLGAIQRQSKLQIVELEQHVAFGDLLIVVNQDFADDSRHVGRQSNHVGLHIGIIRRLTLPPVT